MEEKQKHEGYGLWIWICLAGLTLAAMVTAVCVGSVSISIVECLQVFKAALTGTEAADPGTASILLSVRLPRVLCVALSGASLSVCGTAMQGLLKNPLADGAPLGISSGASLGAALAIAFGFQLPQLPFSGSMILAALFAFGSLILILSLSYMLDSSFSTNTIILLGIVYSMFMSSILSLVVTFAPDKLKQITFWTMGSLAGSSYQNALVLFVMLAVCGTILIHLAEELNAFAIGEENAMNVGVDVKRVRLVILITISLLIGACVSIGGTIGFVGLVTPHIIRLMTGPNHKRLLPASMFGGAAFLTLADLAARTIVPPLELPIGVVTSFVGAILFVYVYYKVGRTAR